MKTLRLLRCVAGAFFAAAVPLQLCAQAAAPTPTFRTIPEDVRALMKEARKYYTDKEYDKAAKTYALIIQKEEHKVPVSMDIDAACAFGLSGQSDSAMVYLTYAAQHGYSFYGHMMAYGDLKPLHTHTQWPAVCEQVDANRCKKIKNPNHLLIRTLDTIIIQDQATRWERRSVIDTYGSNSGQLKDLMKKMARLDSLNLAIVERILDKYGWISNDEVGEEGTRTLFLVVQHAPIEVEEKYLPAMRQAVDKKILDQKYIGYLEDRIAVSKGEKQLYGSQVDNYEGTEKFYVSPVEDVARLDARRQAVGMEPMVQYMSMFKIAWSVEGYEKELPLIMADIEKKKTKH